MPERYKPKPLSAHIVVGPFVPDILDYDDAAPDVSVVIEELRTHILSEKTPGGAMLVRKMDAFDHALARLYEALEKFTTETHHKTYAADLVTRRYLRLQRDYMFAFLNYVAHEIERRTKGFNLTEESTRLPPETEAMAEAKAWRRNYLNERAKAARRERALGKTPTARRSATSVARSSPSRPARKSAFST